MRNYTVESNETGEGEEEGNNEISNIGHSVFTSANPMERDFTKVMSPELLEKATLAAQDQFGMSFDNKAYFDKIMSGDFDSFSEMDKRVAMAEADERGYKLHTKHAPEYFPIAGTKKVVYPGLLKIKNILNSAGVLKRWTLLNLSLIHI
mgnify:CR=1 FL=1